MRQTRNIGIIAHVDAGKTTLTERILFYTGRIHAIGDVDAGTTTTDHHALEQQKGITITAAAVRSEWRGHAIHLIDTPGHADFNIEVERSLRVLDGAVVLVDGVAGVEPQTEKVWRQADVHGVARLCFVNKLDRAGASFERCLNDLRARLGANPVAIALPVGEESAELGLVDLVRMRELAWEDERGRVVVDRPISDGMRERANAARRRLVDACADADPDFERKYVETEDVGEEDFVRAIRLAVRQGSFLPVLGGSAFKNRGVQPLLDAIVAYLPAPSDEEGPLRAFCFKVAFDRFGQLTFVRVYAGELRKGTTVTSSRTGKTLRIGRIVRVFADAHEEVDVLEAGDIGAIVGGGFHTGETLADPAHPCTLPVLRIPPPVVRLAVEPKTTSDRDRFGAAIERLLAEDPSLSLSSDPETGQTILAGIGQLHLEVTLERLRLEHDVVARAGKPKVAYRETVGAAIEHEVKYVKQSGGPGQYAHLRIALSPAERGAGLVFENRIRGGAIAAKHVVGVRKGIVEAMHEGVLAGHPVADVCVALLDGSEHSNDSSELSFKIAAVIALKEAMKRAQPRLLEPLMDVEVLVADEHLGAVIGDLAARRATVTSLDQRASTRVVRAEAPLVEMFGYDAALAAITHGRGTHDMALGRYELVGNDIAARLLAET